MHEGKWAVTLLDAVKALVTGTIETCTELISMLMKQSDMLRKRLEQVCNDYCRLKCEKRNGVEKECIDKCYRECMTWHGTKNSRENVQNNKIVSFGELQGVG